MTDITKIQELIADELRTACEKYGDTFNSLKETYAVILEEVEEAQWEMGQLSNCLQDMWYWVKKVKPDDPHSHDCIRVAFKDIKGIRHRAISAIQELIQVAAMCQKALNKSPYDLDDKSPENAKQTYGIAGDDYPDPDKLPF